MNDDPLTRLARVNPVPGDMPPLAIDVEQLKGAPPTYAPHRPDAGKHRRRALAMTVPALAVVCAAALLAALAFSHHPQRSALPPATGLAGRSQFVALTRVLAVFGGPSQTYRAACRGAHSLAVCTLRTESSQVRSVAVGDGYTAVIEPTEVTKTTPLAKRGQAIVLALHGPSRGPVQSSAPTTLQTFSRHGLLVSAFKRLGEDRGAILVPNGVAHVTLSHLAVQSSRRRGSAITVSTSKVAHNISILSLRGVTEHNLKPGIAALRRYFISSTGRLCHANLAVYALPATAQMAWRSPAGKLLRRVPVTLRVDVGIASPPQSTVSRSWHCT